jgi:pimeloyl-ACP methyl ester carboxylesterase
VPRAGHFVNLDQPQAVADALLRFAATVTDSASRA